MTEPADIPWMSASDIAAAVRAGDLSVVEIAETMISRIEAVNPEINAYVTFDAAGVRERARTLQADVDSGQDLGPLHGVPFSIKALTALDGGDASAGLLPLAGAVGDHDAPLVRRLKEAGGLFLGQTNSPEFAYYGGTDGHLWGATQNPWKHGYSAGGSSGGAAAAVAAGLGPLAEGSDGAGSVRIPAALCGVYGLKPSLGRIPMGSGFGTFSFHGPLTRTVADSALMLNIISGAADSDPFSFPRDNTDFLEGLDGGVEGWRIAYSPDLNLGYVDPEVAEICAAAVGAFSELGATVEKVTPEWPPLEEAMWKGLWVPGYSRLHDMLDWSELHDKVDEQLIQLVTTEAESVTAVDLGRANTVRARMWETYSLFMKDYDILISPTLTTATFPLGQFAPDYLAGEPLSRQLLGWLLTYPFNMLTVPAASIPAGFTADGRPVGLHIAGRHRGEAGVLRASAAFESVRPWADVRPALTLP